MILTPADIIQARSIHLAGRERVQAIIAEVAEASGLPRGHIVSKKRRIDLDRARQLIMFVADREDISHDTIAAALCRDRTTVAKGVKAEANRRQMVETGTLPKPQKRLTAKPQEGRA